MNHRRQNSRKQAGRSDSHQVLVRFTTEEWLRLEAARNSVGWPVKRSSFVRSIIDRYLQSTGGDIHAATG